MANYVACDFIIQETSSGQDSYFSLATHDVLEQRNSVYIYMLVLGLNTVCLHSSRCSESVAHIVYIQV